MYDNGWRYREHFEVLIVRVVDIEECPRVPLRAEVDNPKAKYSLLFFRSLPNACDRLIALEHCTLSKQL